MPRPSLLDIPKNNIEEGVAKCEAYWKGTLYPQFPITASYGERVYCGFKRLQHIIYKESSNPRTPGHRFVFIRERAMRLTLIVETLTVPTDIRHDGGDDLVFYKYYPEVKDYFKVATYVDRHTARRMVSSAYPIQKDDFSRNRLALEQFIPEKTSVTSVTDAETAA